MGRIKKHGAKQQLPNRKKCIFCPSNADSAEHVLPDWLNRWGPGGGSGVRQLNVNGTPVIENGGPFSKKLKIVCRPCNNVWMSGMETEVRPTLVRVFEWDGRAPLQLDAGEQLALARWAFKTAVVAAHVGGQPTFPFQQCRDFRSTDTLPACFIRIGATEPPPVGYTHGGESYDLVAEFQYLPANATAEINGARSTFLLYRAAFRLYNVAFDLLGYDHPAYQFTPVLPQAIQDALTQIWPSPPGLVTWPPARTVESIGGIKALVTYR
ncbi:MULTISPECIES: hypothetical protein [unclassified Streptomyces]|uniref:hypothetical protein n=1 Tax=unclassified Streptomyces TaxID=2593676 RepID=UPI0033286846